MSQGRTVIYNALLFHSISYSSLPLPWCTFTEPEIAHVGKYEHELQSEGVEYQTFTRQFSTLDRAICESVKKGFIKVHVKKGGKEILGATAVGGPAGDMISQFTMAMENSLDISQVGAAVAMYPSYGDGIKSLTDQWRRTQLTPFASKVLKKIIKIRR
jgi:pyruvate/2-oxoglutarate dehydrogenase complex dihydrolipoamide dehydrogenase (E3) component